MYSCDHFQPDTQKVDLMKQHQKCDGARAAVHDTVDGSEIR